MKLVMIGLAALLLGGGATGATAQTMSYAEAGALLAKSCGPDIEKYCPKVNLGDGALKDCLAAQGTKINPQCIGSYQAAVVSLTARAAAQASVPKLCRNDVVRHCQGMVPGDAHFLSCLNTARRVVSAGCTQALTDAGWN